MATEKKLKEFRVLEYNFNTRQKSTYDVLPYFRRMWFEAEWDCFEKSKVKTKEDLKKWIEDASRYNFWARCEYEFLMAPWPYHDEKLKEELRKIDVHEQLMMNIDIITYLLLDEFEIKCF